LREFGSLLLQFERVEVHVLLVLHEHLGHLGLHVVLVLGLHLPRHLVVVVGIRLHFHLDSIVLAIVVDLVLPIVVDFLVLVDLVLVDLVLVGLVLVDQSCLLGYLLGLLAVLLGVVEILLGSIVEIQIEHYWHRRPPLEAWLLRR